MYFFSIRALKKKYFFLHKLGRFDNTMNSRKIETFLRRKKMSHFFIFWAFEKKKVAYFSKMKYFCTMFFYKSSALIA
jgi:hypothetical protein